MAHTTRQSLLKGLVSNEANSWQEFQEFYTPLIRLCGQDYKLTPDEQEDLRQEVMVELFTNNVIAKYDPKRGHFRSLLRTVIHHKAYQIRRTRMPNADPQREEAMQAVNTLEALWDEEWLAFRREVALKQLRESVDEKQYMAFELYALQGMEPKTVATILEFSVNQVYIAKNRLGTKLREIMATLEKEEEE